MFYFFNIFIALFAEMLLYGMMCRAGIELNGFWGLVLFILLYISSATQYNDAKKKNQKKD